MFRSAFKSRRCLVLADGYYEWRRVGQVKQPIFYELSSGRPFAFAGLWESWRGGEKTGGESALESCTIVTTEANALASPVHDRMPVILDPTDYEEWLSPETEVERLESLLVPWEGDLLGGPAGQHVRQQCPPPRARLY